MPDWYINEPLLEQELKMYIDCFNKFSTTRQFQGGPIPYMVIEQYIEKNEFCEQHASFLHTVINALDSVYSKWMNTKIKKESKK